MAQIDYIVFKEKAERILQVIVRMNEDLKKYAARPDASQFIIDKRNAEIAALEDFHNESLEIAQVLHEDTNDAYSRGYEQGAKAKEYEYTHDPYSDIEAKRRDSIIRAEQAQPHLYQRFIPIVKPKIGFQK